MKSVVVRTLASVWTMMRPAEIADSATATLKTVDLHARAGAAVVRVSVSTLFELEYLHLQTTHGMNRSYAVSSVVPSHFTLHTATPARFVVFAIVIAGHN